jgi:hypothetical protein
MLRINEIKRLRFNSAAHFLLKHLKKHKHSFAIIYQSLDKVWGKQKNLSDEDFQRPGNLHHGQKSLPKASLLPLLG